MFLDFASSIVWPVVVVVIAILFRAPIGKLINEIEEAVFPGGSLKRRGDRQISEINREIGAAPPPIPGAESVTSAPSMPGQLDGTAPSEDSAIPRSPSRTSLWLSPEAVPPIIPILRDLKRDLPRANDIQSFGADVAVFRAARSVALAMELCDGSVGENNDPLLTAWFRTMSRELLDLADAVRDGRTAMSATGALQYSVTVATFLDQLIRQLESFAGRK